jgi:hypothetical protein
VGKVTKSFAISNAFGKKVAGKVGRLGKSAQIIWLTSPLPLVWAATIIMEFFTNAATTSPISFVLLRYKELR